MTGSARFHATQRRRLIDKVEGGILVFAGYEAMQLSGDMAAPFLQESTFWWLTGIEEAGWRLIIDCSRNGRAVLYRPDSSYAQRIFDGGMSEQESMERSGVDEVRSRKDFEHDLMQIRRTHAAVKTLEVQDGGQFVANPAQADLNRVLRRLFPSIESIASIVKELRAIKQPEEIARIRAAVDQTIAAFAYVHERLDTYSYEYEIEAVFTGKFRHNNLVHAYSPIVASGKNACTLHYDHNTSKLDARSGVLIDIGARHEGYSADITRTYARKPTKRLIAVHEVVERAHQRCIALLAPNMSVMEYISKVDMIMKESLCELQLMKHIDDEQAFRRYFPHAISHGLGIDTHDSLGKLKVFQEGMVLTVEPGIYIPEESIGVRIEDDILITARGHENLSGALSTKLTPV